MKEIYFDHKGQKYVAKVHDNLKELEDCALVVFENDFNEEVLFSNVIGIWTSVSDLQTRYPQTYTNIQQAILFAFS